MFIFLAVILSVAVAGLALEYARRSKNDTDKEARLQERINNMEKKLGELDITLVNSAAQMRELERLLQHYLPPSKPSNSSSNAPSSSSSPAASKPTGQAYSIVYTSTMQSSLIQLPTIDYLFFPMVHMIQQVNDFIVSLLSKTKH